MTNQTRVIIVRVAGVTFEDRQEYLKQLGYADPVKIIPEPDNPYDKNALAVHIAHKGQVWHCGYIPKERAAEIAPALQGESVMAQIQEITGGFDKPDGSVASHGLRIRIEIPYEQNIDEIQF